MNGLLREIELLAKAIYELLRVKREYTATQAWFWSPEWQQMEQEAEHDLRDGNYEVFETDKDFLDSLEGYNPYFSRREWQYVAPHFYHGVWYYVPIYTDNSAAPLLSVPWFTTTDNAWWLTGGTAQ